MQINTRHILPHRMPNSTVTHTNIESNQKLSAVIATRSTPHRRVATNLNDVDCQPRSHHANELGPTRDSRQRASPTVDEDGGGGGEVEALSVVQLRRDMLEMDKQHEALLSKLDEVQPSDRYVPVMLMLTLQVVLLVSL